MILVNSFRNTDEQIELIANGSRPNCDFCELADRFPNCCNRRQKENSGSKYDMKEFDSCYIPEYAAVIECGNKKVADGIGDAYKIDPSYFLGEDDYDEDDYDEDDYDEDDYDEDNYDEDDYDEDDYDEDEFYAEPEEINENGWEPAQPVFISAQTGHGKNYFIENALIRYVVNYNKEHKSDYKVLIISNRLALKKQLEKHIEGDKALSKIYRYNNKNNKDKTAFVITYQGILRKAKELKRQQKKAGSSYLYVICDEAHFFTSDALFNYDTERILSKIVKLFKNSIRIYMSATPYECLKYIVDKESEYFDHHNDWLNNNPFALYHFDRDYSYLNVMAYSQIDELHNIIADSVKRKKRWLIFLDNKNQCTKLKAELESLIFGEAKSDKTKKSEDDEKKIIIVSAESKQDENYTSLIEKEALGSKTYVLISTSVLDNGVNLQNVDNIVVSDIDIVKCLQMAGRARSNKAEKTRYIRRFDEKYISRRKDDYEKRQKAYHSFDLADIYSNVIDQKERYEREFLSRYYDGDVREWEVAKSLFGREFENPKQLYKNGISQELVDSRVEMYGLILEEMEEEKQQETAGNTHVGQGYLEYQLFWFCKEYCEDNDLTFMKSTKEKKALFDFLKSCLDNKCSVEPKEFSKKFTLLYDNAYGRADKNLNRNYEFTKINRLLAKSELPFTISKDDKGNYVILEYNDDGSDDTDEK